MMNDIAAVRVGLIGFGEVGQLLAADLSRSLRSPIKVWDRLFTTPDSIPVLALRQIPNAQGTRCLAEALRSSTLVISAVTASECLAVAREAAESLEAGSYFLDLNSVSP